MGYFILQSTLAALNLTIAMHQGDAVAWFFAGACVAFAFDAAASMVFER